MYKIYVKGYAGNLGTRVLIEKKYDELSKRFSKDYLNDLVNTLDEILKDGEIPSLNLSNYNDTNIDVYDIETIGKGGILTALWKICERNKWGLKYSLRSIPILQGTIEISNFFDINPYRLLTKNAFIIASDDEHNDSKYYPHILTYIGDITNERKRVRIDGKVEAFLTKDYKDEIDKVLSNYTKTMGHG